MSTVSQRSILGSCAEIMHFGVFVLANVFVYTIGLGAIADVVPTRLQWITEAVFPISLVFGILTAAISTILSKNSVPSLKAIVNSTFITLGGFVVLFVLYFMSFLFNPTNYVSEEELKKMGLTETQAQQVKKLIEDEGFVTPEEMEQMGLSPKQKGEVVAYIKTQGYVTEEDVVKIIATQKSIDATQAAIATATSQAVNYIQPTIDMVEISEGNIILGSSYTEEYDFDPVHTVYISEFRIDRYEVTNKEYSKCAGVGICNAPTKPSSNTRNRYYDNPEYANYPVIYVSWQDAKTYCEWRGARLPTEAEWEKSAKYWSRDVGTGSLYPWGNIDPSPTHANFSNSDTTKVGSFLDGKTGTEIYDLSGNVFEWVNDFYSADYYIATPLRDPQGPQSSSQGRVVRGGAWSSTDKTDLWVFKRFAFDEETRRSDLGFRCAENQ